MPRLERSHFRQSMGLLLTRRFGTFWFASLLANIGTWAQQMAQPWLMLSLGASPFLLGLDSFASGAPVLLLTLVGGALADQTDRRRTIAIFQSIQMVCPVVLVVLILTGQVSPWMVIAMSLVVGVTDALSMPSFQSIVPSIVRPDQIPTGIALNSTQFNLSRILGPAIAGVLMASVGMAGAFAVSALSYVPFILVALWVLPALPAAKGLSVALDHRQLLASVGAVAREPSLRGGLLTVLTTALLCAPLITFCPVLVKEVFQGSAADFSLALGAFGLGGLLGASALLAVDPQRDRRRFSAWFALLYAVIVLLAALNPWSLGLVALLLCAGVAMTVSNASANAVLQSCAPSHLRGQAASMFMLAMRGGMSLGSLVTGLTVHAWGVREALVINGTLALLIHVIVGRVWVQAPLVAASGD
ncbi:MAG: MFS transporter [Aquabacterium sp.]|uniref:MFS transporter n=1 Tax=Aquabacterium sp. TaxID=1872578 RepID=UPI003BE944CD